MPTNSAATAARRAYSQIAVSTVSPAQLVVLLYDRAVLDCRYALVAMEQRDVPSAHERLVHAQEIVAELLDALDVEAWPDGASLADLYRYVHGLLVQANVTKDAAPVRACLRVLEPLADAWRHAASAAR